MYAVLVEIDVSDVDRESGLSGLREQIVPGISQLPGFRSGTWLTGNEAGRALSLTLWESEVSARAFAGYFTVGSSPQLGCDRTLRGPRGRSHRVTENTTQRPRPSPNHSSSTSPATSAGERPVTSSCLTDASLRIQVN